MKTCGLRGCRRQHYAKGYCNPHWRRWKETGDPGPVEIADRAGVGCAFPDCTERHSARGYCATHYAQRHRGKSLAPIAYRMGPKAPPSLDADGLPQPRRPWRLQTERDDQGRKLCRVGNHWADESEFGQSARNADGLGYLCRECARNKHRLENYGITPARYQEMLAAQGGGCAICGSQCGTGRMLAVDHDRSCCPDYVKTCGRCVRGLLCGACNQGIGKLQDSAELLRRAAEYLTR